MEFVGNTLASHSFAWLNTFVSSLVIWFLTLILVLQPELSKQYFFRLYYIECRSTKYMVRTSPLRRIAEVATTTMTSLWLREHGPACV